MTQFMPVVEDLVMACSSSLQHEVCVVLVHECRGAPEVMHVHLHSVLLGQAVWGLNWQLELWLGSDLIMASEVDQVAQLCQGQCQPAANMA